MLYSRTSALANGAPAEVRLLGPAEAPVFRLKGYYRFHFQLQSASAAALHQLLRRVLPTVRPPNGVEFSQKTATVHVFISAAPGVSPSASP